MVRRVSKTGLLAGVVATGAILAQPAAAADDLADYAEGVNGGYGESHAGIGREILSRWYVRGDISWNIDGQRRDGYSIVEGVDSSAVNYEYQDALGLRVGFGYQVNPAVRLEMTGEHIMSSTFSALRGRDYGGYRDETFIPVGETDPVTESVFFDNNGNVISPGDYPDPTVAPYTGTEELDAEYSALNFMINGYFDLPTMGRFTPYVGAGVGLARINYSESHDYECEAEDGGVCQPPVDFAYDDTYWAMSWQLSAGTAIHFNEQLSMDIGYTYLDIGHGPKLNYDDGTAIDSDGMQIHQVRAGLRYKLW